MSFKTNCYLTAALCLSQAIGLNPVAGALFAAALSLLGAAFIAE